MREEELPTFSGRTSSKASALGNGAETIKKCTFAFARDAYRYLFRLFAKVNYGNKQHNKGPQNISRLIDEDRFEEIKSKAKVSDHTLAVQSST